MGYIELTGTGAYLPGSQPGVSGTVAGDAYGQLVTDASAFSLTLDSQQRDAIQWIVATEDILAGTSASEWRISGRRGKVITAMNYDMGQQTIHGSKDMSPLLAGDAVCFVNYVGKKLHEMKVVTDLNWNNEYIAPDLLVLAEHITQANGITSMAYQKRPDSIIWATLANGDLISCTYDPEQNIVAWARHPMQIGEGQTDPSELTGTYDSPTYPTLRSVADQADPGLTHTTPIANLTDLENMANDLTGNYYLTGDIDASATADPGYNSGNGWEPIGPGTTAGNYFEGTLDGCGYTITDLTISQASQQRSGLFGCVDHGQIANLTLADVDISGTRWVGALIGLTYDSNIWNCHASGEVKVTGTVCSLIGGMIGQSDERGATNLYDIYDCTSSVTVDGENHHTDTGVSGIGGFVGSADIQGDYHNCHVTGDVIQRDATGTGGTDIGGFVGRCAGAAVFNDCSATGDVTGDDSVGGFVGDAGAALFNRCFATGDVIANAPDGEAGGFSGSAGLTVTDCYAWGNVTGGATSGLAGGFAGNAGTSYYQCYSIGTTTANGDGGFSAYTGTMYDVFWDTQTSLDSTSAGTAGDPEIFEGHETSWMKTQSNYPDTWDFDTVWQMGTPVAWSDSSIGVGMKSVCVIPGSTEDEIWITTGRKINDALSRTIERMKVRYWGTDQDDCFFVDSGYTYDSTPTTTITGLDHLEGETVSVLADGAVADDETIDQASTVHVGLSYTYKLKPMRRGMGETGRSAEVVLSVHRSLGADYGDGDDTYDVEFAGTDLETGDIVVHTDEGYNVDEPFEVTGSDPLPCTIRALVPRLEKTGR
ncbi:MAG: M26 family metallopeptidase [Planctomycetota bacterium]|jgi:hypothetical protein